LIVLKGVVAWSKLKEVRLCRTKMGRNRLRKGSATIGEIANRPATAGHLLLIGIPHITGGIIIIIGGLIGGQCQEASSSRL
jgi:hypothetical protein